MKHILKKKLVHLGTLQMQQLEKISKQTGYATAELIRRSIDEYIEKRYPNILEDSNGEES
jgi:predicted DNA-binding protein